MKLLYRKLHPDAKTPRRAHASDAGLDLAPLSSEWIEPGDTLVMDTGIAVAIPLGYVGLLRARSSARMCSILIDGVIDSGYRGTIKLCVTNAGNISQRMVGGEYIAQLIIAPCALPQLELVTELDETERGEGGFGSSDGGG